MCRLLAYKGPPVILDDLLYEPKHSLINQSYHAREMDEPLNGDGFGVGWYNREIDPNPAVFTSIQPAWNNQNLQYITPKISSECVFAHVRSASVGNVNQLNCHPFHRRNLLMMHNGGINNFQKIRRPLLSKLSDEHFQAIKGQTDSEHIFALFLENLTQNGDSYSLADYSQALKATVQDIIELKIQHGLKKSSTLNILITNGQQIVGCRLATGDNTDPPSLYYATGERFECKNDKYAMRDVPQNKPQEAVLFVSERLNKHGENWQTVPANHFFTVDANGTADFSTL